MNISIKNQYKTQVKNKTKSRNTVQDSIPAGTGPPKQARIIKLKCKFTEVLEKT